MATDTQTIKDKIDIVDLIGEYVQLKPSGTNHKGLCPFHHEKSPSFMVHRDRQFWHCFGCGKGGDIFTFVQEMEGMEFVEALRYLAQKAGVPLETVQSETNTSQRNRIKEINSKAAYFFHNFLLQIEAAKPAQNYLAKRGVSAESIDQWQIGFVSDQWDLLTKYLLKNGFGIDDLVASGLTIMREGASMSTGQGFYDRFRGRIMFPIWDVHGTIVGFTGRVLVETEHSGGKYVNTPQTLVYDKSRVVFGLDKAKQEIKAKNLIVVVEGQMDVIACHQAGMKNVVAASGTAFTEEQVKLLKRYSTNLAIAFDADAAGQNAADRGIDVALAEGMSIKVITIPPDAGKDADECIKKDPRVWFTAVEQAQNIMNYYLDKSFRGKDVHDPRVKQGIADMVLPKITRIPYAVEKDHWLRILGERLGVDVGILREDMARLQQSSKFGVHSSKGETAVEVKKNIEQTRLGKLIEGLLALLIKYPQLLLDPQLGTLSQALSTSPYSLLYERIKKQYTDSGLINLDPFRDSVDADNTINALDILQLQGEKDFSDFTPAQAVKELQSFVGYIRDEWLRDRRRVLQQEIAMAERAGDTERMKQLVVEFQTLT